MSDRPVESYQVLSPQSCERLDTYVTSCQKLLYKKEIEAQGLAAFIEAEQASMVTTLRENIDSLAYSIRPSIRAQVPSPAVHAGRVEAVRAGLIVGAAIGKRMLPIARQQFIDAAAMNLFVLRTQAPDLTVTGFLRQVNPRPSLGRCKLIASLSELPPQKERQSMAPSRNWIYRGAALYLVNTAMSYVIGREVRDSLGKVAPFQRSSLTDDLRRLKGLVPLTTQDLPADMKDWWLLDDEPFSTKHLPPNMRTTGLPEDTEEI